MTAASKTANKPETLQRDGVVAERPGLIARYRSPEFQKKLKKKKNDMYRTSRMLHTYLSAIAFMLLLFFAVSGLLLNHPEWLQSERERLDTTYTVETDALTMAKASENPADALAVLIADGADVPGELKSYEDLGDGYQLEYRGLGGSASVFVDTETGEAEITVRKATFADKVHNLHKGKYTGTVWPWVIDITAYLTLILSLFGFIILFTVKLRLQKSLRIIGASIGLIGATIYFLVP